MRSVQVLRTGLKLGLSNLTAFGLLAAQLVSVVFETFSLAIIVPTLDFVENSNREALIAKAKYWDVLFSSADALGIVISIPLLLGLSFSAVLIRQGFIFLRNRFELMSRECMVRDLRLAIFEGYVNTSLEYHDRTHLGSMVNDVVTECQNAVIATIYALKVISSSILLVLYVGMLATMSVPLTLGGGLSVALAGLIAARLVRASRRVGGQISEANAGSLKFLTERLRSVRLVLLSGTREEEIAAAKGLLWRQSRLLMSYYQLGNRVDAVIEPTVAAALLGFIYFGAEVFHMTSAQIGVFGVVVIRLAPVLKELLKTRAAMVGMMAAQERTLAVLNDLRKHHEEMNSGRPFALDRALTFDQIVFRYPEGDRVALERVAFEIKAGQLTALVGPSGSGKSTLVDLLPRLRRPTSGRVLVDGEPIENFDLHDLRRKIGFVSQVPLFFDMSVAELVRYGRADITDQQLHEAARLVGALDFIEALPKGWDTQIGETGGRLSGGQRQRLDAARALVRQPVLLIMDEPTSHLDADAEEVFQDLILRLRATRTITILVIAHRLSTVVPADRIVVLNHGRMEQIGTHGELMACDGWYAQAFSKQTGAAMGGDGSRESPRF